MALSSTKEDLETGEKAVPGDNTMFQADHDHDDSVAGASSADASSTDESISSGNGKQDERDEVAEINKMSRKMTSRIRTWRMVVTSVLLMTAVAVTFFTLRFLEDEQRTNFQVAFEQFARTLGEAATNHQGDILDAYQGLSNTLTAYAQGSNKTWPFFSLPRFESYARVARKQSHTEEIVVYNRVEDNQVNAWVNFSTANYEASILEGHMIEYGNTNSLRPINYKPFISRIGRGGFVPDLPRSDYFVSWSYSPPPATYALVNWNVGSIPSPGSPIDALLLLKNQSLISSVRPYTSQAALGQQTFTYTSSSGANKGDSTDTASEDPRSFLFVPVHKYDDDENSEIVAVVSAAIAWDTSMMHLLPDGVLGLNAIIRNTCNQTYTYRINGPNAKYVGEGDLHDKKYDGHEWFVDLSIQTSALARATPGHCLYTMHIYPTDEFYELYKSSTPKVFASIIALTFVMNALVFFVYDVLVQRRNRKLVHQAAQSNAIVSEMFPGKFRDHFLGAGRNNKNANVNGGDSAAGSQGYNKLRHLKGFMDDAANQTTNELLDLNSKPLADLFLETTVMFADVVGFTAWSSVREPSQVFTLLETVYSSFDKIAKKRRIFKVETVGDCYVAVAGLPDPRKDHAIAMCRFARDIMMKMAYATKQLERTLGPDTGDLSLRIGIHSGPVTAGVLRGERSRFQLFGDTMNTCARIESTGERGKIHLSAETAELLIKAEKASWVIKRNDTVVAKGKGAMETYWLAFSGPNHETNSSSGEGSHNIPATFELTADDANALASGERNSRLIDWNIEILQRLLKQVVARRDAEKEVSVRSLKAHGNHKNPYKIGQTSYLVDDSSSSDPMAMSSRKRNLHMTGPTTPSSDGNVNGADSMPMPLENQSQPCSFLDEVKEIITLPEFDSNVARKQELAHEVCLSLGVVSQLREYVSTIASMYRNNPFHNFDHASHVIMSVVKLMSRIVAPTEELLDEESEGLGMNKVAATLHDHTYGITSDPLTQFACAFSALIHDVDHTGVPNAQLVKEHANVATKYNNRSVAEQNSLELAWELLMQPRFDELRSTIYSDEHELRRFRQLVVNSVMATDIVDKDLKALRNGRWEKAFSESSSTAVTSPNDRDNVNRKATIVIEHLIQASDVAHTMQHWHIYRKWNEKFFRECYEAYIAGRAETDPSQNWYKGEIGFFDFYIIPLAKKLKDCGVFGKSSDEYLSYALKNRQEWEARGQEVVAEMVEKIKREDRKQ